MAGGINGPSWLDPVLIGWFVLVALAVIYVAWDAFTNNPQMTVMKWGWVLVTLYTGPVGAALYILACKEPDLGEHEDFIKPMWKQALGSTIHCIAGDATGIIVAASVTAALGLPMWLDTISEYLFGFAFGLTIFQALFMKSTFGGTYLKALKRSFLPEWLSMNGVMAGMIPTMVILMSRDTAAMSATSIRFWAIMSLATLLGMVIAYPINWWLVAKGLKRGMGTVRALGKGGHSLAVEKNLNKPRSREVYVPNPEPMGATNFELEASRIKMQGNDSNMMRDADSNKPDKAGQASVASEPQKSNIKWQPTKADETGMAGMDMEITKPKVTRTHIVAMTLITLLLLAGGVLLAALFGDFTGSGSMAGMDMGNGNSSSKQPAPVSSLPSAPMQNVLQMNGLVMPPGMIMTSDMTNQQMQDMATVDLSKISYSAPADARGDQPLTPQIVDGVKVLIWMYP